jgi:hypothetical protein
MMTEKENNMATGTGMDQHINKSTLSQKTISAHLRPQFVLACWCYRNQIPVAKQLRCGVRQKPKTIVCGCLEISLCGTHLKLKA